MAGWADSIKFIKSKIFKKIIKNGDYEIKKAENAEYAYNAGHASDAMTLYGGTPINEGDLNTYVTEGNFYIPNDAVASRIANTPIARSGQLKVFSCVGAKNTNADWIYIVQIYMSRWGQMFVRNYFKENSFERWSDWQQFSGDGSRATTADSATNDGNGNNIAETYPKRSEFADGTFRVEKANFADYARRLSIDANVWKNIGELTKNGVEYRLERGTYLVKADMPAGTGFATPHVTMLIDIKYTEDADGYCCRSTSFDATNSCYIEYITNTNVLKSNVMLINVSMVAIA